MTECGGRPPGGKVAAIARLRLDIGRRALVVHQGDAAHGRPPHQLGDWGSQAWAVHTIKPAQCCTDVNALRARRVGLVSAAFDDGDGDGESACKRDPVQRRSAWVTIPLMRPTRGGPCRHGGRAARPLCLALLRVGFTEPYESPRTLVRSYRTVAP